MHNKLNNKKKMSYVLKQFFRVAKIMLKKLFFIKKQKNLPFYITKNLKNQNK